jgi:hypothetical protein
MDSETNLSHPHDLLEEESIHYFLIFLLGLDKSSSLLKRVDLDKPEVDTARFLNPLLDLYESLDILTECCKLMQQRGYIGRKLSKQLAYETDSIDDL